MRTLSVNCFGIVEEISSSTDSLKLSADQNLTDFDAANRAAVERMKLIAENIDENTWPESSRELLKMFREGNPPKNVCLGDDGTLAFIFVD